MPDSTRRRALIFLLLFVYHGAHSLNKTFAMALLAQVSWLALIVYTLADHVAFLLLKLARHDFIYWAPGVGAIVSLLARFCAKVVTDFTGALSISRHIETAIRLGECALRWQDWCIFGIRASSEAPTTFSPPS